MGLETPLWLLGLLVGALPIIAHRMRQRDLRRLALPTFTMLAQAQAQQRSNRRLNDLLLLITRVALLSLLALSLAAPFTYTTVSFGDGEVSSTLVVIDDSMSMRREHGGSSALSKAINRATEVISSLPDGSEVGIVLAGTPARALLEPTRDLTLATRTLRKVVPADRSTDLNGGLALAMQQLQASQQGKRRLLVLSDFARHASLDHEAVTRSGVEVRFEPLDQQPPARNLAIVRAQPTPLANAESGEIALSVEVQAFGPPPPEASLRAIVRGQAQPPVSLAFEGNRAHATVRAPAPAADQDPTIELQLSPSDELPQDNRYQVLLSGGGGVRLLLVNGDPQPGTRNDEVFYLMQALRLLPTDSGSAVRVRSLDAASLEHEDLSQNDVVLLANVPGPSGEVAGRLREFVRSGGGLILAAGSHVQAPLYNERLADLLPGHISTASRTSDLTLSVDDDASPLAAGLPGLSQVRTRQRLLVDTSATPLLSFVDGSPAALGHAVERGRVLLFCSTLDDDWTDLPIRPGFLPLLATFVRYAAGDRALFAGQYRAGDRVQIPVPAGARVMEVVAPDGTRSRFDNIQHALLPYQRTADSGAYRILAGTGSAALHFVPERSFVVERPSAESNLLAGDAARSQHGDLTGGPQQTEVRKPLSPLLWAMCALLALLEAALRLGNGITPWWRPQRA